MRRDGRVTLLRVISTQPLSSVQKQSSGYTVAESVPVRIVRPPLMATLMLCRWKTMSSILAEMLAGSGTQIDTSASV